MTDPYGPYGTQPPTPYGHTPPIPPGARPGVVTIAAVLGVLWILMASSIMAIGIGYTGATTQMVAVGGCTLLVMLGVIAIVLGVLGGRQGGRVAAFIVFGLLTVGQLLMIVATDVMVMQVLFAVMTVTSALPVVLLAVPGSGAWFTAMTRARRYGLPRPDGSA